VTLDSVPWATAPRWVSHPVNLQGATSTGAEFEIKGRGVDLLPFWVSSTELQLRGSFSVYRSRVQGLPAPDNRLEQQQPWSVNLGFDDKRFAGVLGYGASLAYTPGYTTQQTPAQAQALNRTRGLDAYLSLAFSRETVWRLAVNNLQPQSVVTDQQTVESGGAVLSNRNERQNKAQWTASVALKF
jgi:iron complex outermembrane receptor protein